MQDAPADASGLRAEYNLDTCKHWCNAVTAISFEPIEVPLRLAPHGAIRVGQTRVLLDVVLYEFDSGATPEEIVGCYEGLELADVYSVLSYYLRNRGAVNDYLRQREAEADSLRRTIEASQPSRSGLHARVLARQRAELRRRRS